MKVRITVDELYPYFEFVAMPTINISVIEVDCQTVARWEQVMADFRSVQKEMDKLHKSKV